MFPRNKCLLHLVVVLPLSFRRAASPHGGLDRAGAGRKPYHRQHQWGR